MNVIKIKQQFKHLQNHSCIRDNGEISCSKDGLSICNFFMEDLISETQKPRKRRVMKDGTFFYYNYDSVKDIIESDKERLTKYQEKYKLPRLIDAFTLVYGRVFMFKPVVMKYFIDKYNPTNILDCYAGWGNRLLTCLATNKNYIGVDTNFKLCVKLNEMTTFLKNNIHNINSDVLIVNEKSEDVDYSYYEYNMVFICPPYSLIEKYEDMPAYDNDNDFIKKSLIPTLNNSWNNLSNNGYYIIVVPKSYINFIPFKDKLIDTIIYPKHIYKSRNIGNTNQLKDVETIYVFQKN